MSLLHAEKFRTIGRNAGERGWWLRAFEGTVGPHGEEANRQGKYFVKQLLSDDVRVRIYRNYRTVQSEEFGEIRVCDAKARWMPDELSPMRYDRWICRDRTFDERQTFGVSSDVRRAFNYLYIEKITEVRASNGGQVLLPSSYLLQDNRLKWIGTPPNFDVIVSYRHYEAFEFLTEEMKQGPIDRNGVRLPSWCPLKLLTAGGGINGRNENDH